MEDKNGFLENWEQKRQGGKQKYVLMQALRAASTGLAGVVVASIFLYNSPSEYSFLYYLPTYLVIFFGVFFIAVLNYKYQWKKNEKAYKER